MTGFVVGALVTLALTLALLLRPFYLRRSASATASQRDLNAAILREQLAKLEQDLADGTLGVEDYGQARAELQRRVLQDTTEADATPTLRAPRRTMVAVGLTVPAVALGMYMLIGNPNSMTEAAAGGGAHAGQQELVRMVEALAKKLEKEPDNLQGWAMLARSYKVIGRSQEAELAFERAGSYIDNDAQALANYADVAASNAGGFKGKPAMLIAKALKADPQNAMALWLSGTEALSRDDYKSTLDTWGRLLPLLQPGSEDEKMLRGAIEEVQAKSGIKGAPLAAAPAAASVPTPARTAAAGGPGVSGTVELAPGMKDKTAPSDVVMVIARLPGTRVPLAVLRAPASQLPIKFTLDDSLAMNPQALISTAKEVEIEARVSKTGMAKAEATDLLSAAQTVKVGAAGVTLRVAQVRN